MALAEFQSLFAAVAELPLESRPGGPARGLTASRISRGRLAAS